MFKYMFKKRQTTPTKIAFFCLAGKEGGGRESEKSNTAKKKERFLEMFNVVE